MTVHVGKCSWVRESEFMRLLRIDLSRRKFSKGEIDGSISSTFVDGKGLGAWFLYNEVDKKVEQPLPQGGSQGKTVDKERFKEMVSEYCALRGWDAKGILKTIEQNVSKPSKNRKLTQKRVVRRLEPNQSIL